MAGAVAKTVVAPIERVKLLLQTQGAHPRIKSGEVPPYQGAGPKAFKASYGSAGQVLASRSVCYSECACASVAAFQGYAEDSQLDASGPQIPACAAAPVLLPKQPSPN